MTHYLTLTRFMLASTMSWTRATMRNCLKTSSSSSNRNWGWYCWPMSSPSRYALNPHTHTHSLAGNLCMICWFLSFWNKTWHQYLCIHADNDTQPKIQNMDFYILLILSLCRCALINQQAYLSATCCDARCTMLSKPDLIRLLRACSSKEHQLIPSKEWTLSQTHNIFTKAYNHSFTQGSENLYHRS